MAYNIFEKTWNKEGKASFAAYEKEDEDEAYGLWHQKCATNRKDKNTPRYLVSLMNDEGATMQSEYRAKPVEPEVTPEPEPEPEPKEYSDEVIEEVVPAE